MSLKPTPLETLKISLRSSTITLSYSSDAFEPALQHTGRGLGHFLTSQ